MLTFYISSPVWCQKAYLYLPVLILIKQVCI